MERSEGETTRIERSSTRATLEPKLNDMQTIAARRLSPSCMTLRAATSNHLLLELEAGNAV